MDTFGFLVFSEKSENLVILDLYPFLARFGQNYLLKDGYGQSVCLAPN